MNTTDKITMAIHARHCAEPAHGDACLSWANDQEAARSLVRAGVTYKEPAA